MNELELIYIHHLNKFKVVCRVADYESLGIALEERRELEASMSRAFQEREATVQLLEDALKATRDLT